MNTSRFRSIDSIPEPVSAFHRRLLLPVSLTTRLPQYASRLLRFPCCLCTASTLFTSCIVRFTLPLHSASTLTWYIPNTNSKAFRWFLPHRFVRIVHLLRNSSTFSGSMWSLPKPESSLKTLLLVLFHTVFHV